jgi:hypothetical protein
MSNLVGELSELIERARVELPLAVRQELASALSAITEQERSERAFRAVTSSWEKTHDRSARTAPARAARDARFLRAAGGDVELAERLRREYFVELGVKSAEARRAKKAAS